MRSFNKWLALAAIGTALVMSGALLLKRGELRLDYPSEREFPVRGIDVSHHQGPINWDAIKQQGIRFAFVKATEGEDFQDDAFEYNWSEARLSGLRVGAYHFFSFCKGGEEQARHFIATVSNSKASLPPVIDLEFGGNCSQRPTPEALADSLKQYREEIWMAYGRDPIVYATEEAYAAYGKIVPWKAEVWIRNVYARPKGLDWTFWQFANREQLVGVSVPVDLSVFRGSEKEWQAFLARSE